MNVETMMNELADMIADRVIERINGSPLRASTCSSTCCSKHAIDPLDYAVPPIEEWRRPKADGAGPVGNKWKTTVGPNGLYRLTIKKMESRYYWSVYDRRSEQYVGRGPRGTDSLRKARHLQRNWLKAYVLSNP